MEDQDAVCDWFETGFSLQRLRWESVEDRSAGFLLVIRWTIGEGSIRIPDSDTTDCRGTQNSQSHGSYIYVIFLFLRGVYGSLLKTPRIAISGQRPRGASCREAKSRIFSTRRPLGIWVPRSLTDQSEGLVELAHRAGW